MDKNLNDLISLLSTSPLFPEQTAALRDIQQQLTQNELIVSVIGQFKRGKSSLINAMLGEELLPVGIVPLTSVVTEVRYSSVPRAQVCFSDLTVKEIGFHELDLYCSEQHNHGNYKQVRTVQLWTPRQPFGDGIVLVDTPGVGSINQSNTDAATEHLIHSDAILFVLSVDSPVSQTELDFLLEARDYASKFYFTVNKADVVSCDDLQTFIRYCQSVIQESLGCEITLYPVSAKTQDGVPALTQTLSDLLQTSHDKLLASSIARKLDIVVRQIRGILALEEQASSAPSAALSEKLERMSAKRRELLASADTLEVLAQHHTSQLVDKIGDALAPEAEAIRQALPAQCQDLRQALEDLPLKDFKSDFQVRLDGFLKGQLNQLNQKGTDLLSAGYAEVVSLLTQQTADSEVCLSDFLMQEFGIDYPVTSDSFQVSRQNDLLLHVGLRSLPKLHTELMDHLTSRKKAENRFLAECLRQAEEDIDCNLNNLLYNYRYKMQESLRPLCGKSAERIQRVCGELDQLTALLASHLSTAEEKHSEKTASFRQILEALEQYKL